MAESYHSDGRVTGQRDPLQLRQAAAHLRYLRSEPPGLWGDNRNEQVAHFRDVIYIAIRAVMDLVGGSTFQVSRRKQSRKGKTTFAGSTVAKSLPSSQSHGRDEDYTPLDDDEHPLCRLVERPNPHETFGELAAKVVLQNRLTGVGPVWSVPNRSGKPVELYALRTPHLYPAYQYSREFPNGAWRVQPQHGWGGMLPAGLGSSGAILPSEEVKRFLDPHPLIDWDGYSPLSAGAVHLDVLESVNESRKSAMDNGLQLDAVIVVPGMDPAEMDRLTAQLTQKAGGSRNARKVVGLAPPGGMGDGKGFVQSFGQSPRDMDYANAWEQETRFALSLFGVPAAVVDLATSPNYSERFAAKQQFYDRQGDYLSRLATWFTKVLAWPWCSFPGEYILHIKPKPINDRDQAEKQFSRQLQYDLVTYNEARAKDDLPPVEGGDIPASVYVETQKQKAAPKPEPQPSGAPGENPLAALMGGKGGPTGGAVPTPPNKAAEGSKPPMPGTMAKAMTAACGSEGGFLVPDADAAPRKRKKKVRRFLSRVLKSLDAGEPASHPSPRFELPPIVNVVMPRQEPPVVNMPRQEAPTVNVTTPATPAPVVNFTVEESPRTVTKTAKRGVDGTWTVTETEGN